MNVLSLFDGISCGRVALEKLGVKVGNYYASEIDKNAIKVSEDNYPDIVRLGDINNWLDWDLDWGSIDLVLAGSPCQGFSFAGKQLAFNDERSRLYFKFEEILETIQGRNPFVKFLLENVQMKKEHREFIDYRLGVDGVMINSNLVSAQNRKRWYWFNWDAPLPEDKGIKLVDILDTAESTLPEGFAYKDKSKTLRVGGTGSRLGDKHEWDSPYCIMKPRGFNKGGVRSLDGKVPCITTSAWEYNCEVFDGLNKRRFTVREMEKLQTLPMDYTLCIPKTQASKCIGNGWTVDIISHILSHSWKGCL